jgi:formamidopyrimidine-DNA glycosylase
MPEAVEVRKFADIVSTNVLGHHITHINILKGRYHTPKKPFEGYDDLVKALPLKIESIKTKGKFTYMTLVSESKKKVFYLFNTLGLTGGWTLKSNKKSDFAKCNHCNYMYVGNDIFTFPSILEYITEDRQNTWFKRALNHLNVEFITDKKNISFYFYDQLSFGTLKAVESDGSDGSNGSSNGSSESSSESSYGSGSSVLDKKLKELGPDLLDETTTIEVFKLQLRKKVNDTKPIGNVIVNQKIISGVGNYLRADALWMAKISPFRKVKDVKDTELELLYKSLIGLIWGDYDYKSGVKKGYISKTLKLPNDYQRDFFIYRQDKDINDNTIKKEELYEGSQKRFIYWVDKIQS